MAKTVSAVFKFQGTIEDLTFVNSKRYKPHVRAKKNSKTPFVMTAALAESKARLQSCNQYAKPIFQALRPESRDGGLWSRMVSLLFAELKAGRPLGLECLKGLECNLQHPMGEVIAGGYDFSATVAQNQLGLYVQLHAHPVVEDTLPRTAYQLRFVAIFPDAANGTVYKAEALGPLTKYDAELTALDLPIALPETGAPCLLLMGIVPHLQVEGPVRIMSDSGMKVVWVGGQEDNESMQITPNKESVSISTEDKEPTIETTEEEKEGFMIVKTILRQKIKPNRIVSRNVPSCLSVLLDDDHRKTICKLYLNGSKKYIGTFDEQQQETKIELLTVDDIFNYAELLHKIVEKYDGEMVGAG